MKKNEKYTSSVGEFIINDSGRYFYVGNSYTPSLFYNLIKSTIYEENGFKGCKKDGEILLYPIFDEIGIVPVSGKIYLITGDRFSVLYSNGGYCVNDWFRKDSHFIFEGNKMGWKKDNRIVVPPVFDEVYEWGYGIYFVMEGNSIKYLNERGEEKLSFRRNVNYEYDQPFWQRSDDHNVMTIIECPPFAGLPECNIVDYNDLKIGIDRFDFNTIVNEFINDEDELPLNRKKLKYLTNKFAYEFSAYRFTVKGDNPIDEIFKLMERFDVSDNTWYYVMRITTSPDEKIPSSQLNKLNENLNKLEEHTLGRAFAIGTDKRLEPGTVSVLLVTHYLECCFPPLIQYEFTDVCRSGTYQDVIDKAEELAQFTESEIFDEFKEDFLSDSYDTAVGNFGYSPARDWIETEKILNFLASNTDVFKENIFNIINSLISGSKDASNRSKAEFYFNYLSWLISKDINVNPIKNHQTPLDMLNKAKLRKTNPCKDILDRAICLLTENGGQTYANFKEKFLQDKSKYDFALYLLGQENGSFCNKTLTMTTLTTTA